MVGGFGIGLWMMLFGRVVVGRIKRMMWGVVEGRGKMVEGERVEMKG